jgi:hypothetical protein
MSKIFGYGEDAFTFWALKNHTAYILEQCQDKTAPSDCLIFYRPSFGRQNASVFGEFDGILVSLENIYLIESKWDNLAKFKNDEFVLAKEQMLRHQIFSWYLTHWNRKYFNNWTDFEKEQQAEFHFSGKTIAPSGSLLATNLELILNETLKHCKQTTPNNIKNVMLFFHNKEKSSPPSKISKEFTLIPIDYSKEIQGNFITLSSQ